MVARTLPYPLHSLLLWFVLPSAFTQNRFTKPFPFLQATPYLFSEPSILREDLFSIHPSIHSFIHSKHIKRMYRQFLLSFNLFRSLLDLAVHGVLILFILQFQIIYFPHAIAFLFTFFHSSYFWILISLIFIL